MQSGIGVSSEAPGYVIPEVLGCLCCRSFHKASAVPGRYLSNKMKPRVLHWHVSLSLFPPVSIVKVVSQKPVHIAMLHYHAHHTS